MPSDIMVWYSSSSARCRWCRRCPVLLLLPPLFEANNVTRAEPPKAAGPWRGRVHRPVFLREHPFPKARTLYRFCMTGRHETLPGRGVTYLL